METYIGLQKIYVEKKHKQVYRQFLVVYLKLLRNYRITGETNLSINFYFCRIVICRGLTCLEYFCSLPLYALPSNLFKLQSVPQSVAQNSGACKKYVEIPLSGGKEKRRYVYGYQYY